MDDSIDVCKDKETMQSAEQKGTNEVVQFMAAKEAGKLIHSYNTQVMADGHVRTMMAKLRQNASFETLDPKASSQALREAIKTNLDWLQAPRRAIIGWLNKVFSFVDTLPMSFFWEMDYRLRKIITVSAILERVNLESFGVSPKPEDLPQCLTHILDRLENIRKSGEFERMKTKYIGLVNNHKDALLL